MQNRTRLATGLLVAATVGTTTTGVAAAAPARPTAPLALDGGHLVSTATGGSSVAGYGADLSRFTRPAQWKATATFTVPTVTCTRRTTSALFVELFFGGQDAAGNGLGEGGYALASCNGTTPSYGLNISAQGAANGGVDVATAPGDVVTVSFVASTTSETSTITDVTTGATGAQTGTGFSAVHGMQVSVQGGDAHSVFPRFNRVHFTKVIGAGQALQALAPYAFQATDADGNVKISTSPIDANGRGFTTTYVANFTPTG